MVYTPHVTEKKIKVGKIKYNYKWIKIAAFSECLAGWPRKTALPHGTVVLVSLVCIYPCFRWSLCTVKPHGEIKRVLVPKTFVSLKTENKQTKPNWSELCEVMGTDVLRSSFHCTSQKNNRRIPQTDSLRLGLISTCAKANKNVMEMLGTRWCDRTDGAGMAKATGPALTKHWNISNAAIFQLALIKFFFKKRGNCGLCKAPMPSLKQHPKSLAGFSKPKMGKRWKKHAGERCFCVAVRTSRL